MTGPAPTELIASLAPRNKIDEIWPTSAQDVALARILMATAAERAAETRQPLAPNHEVAPVQATDPSRRSWPRGAAIAVAAVVLLIAVGSVVVVRQWSTTPVRAPLSSTGPTGGVSTAPTAPVASAPPEGTISIPLDHTGHYHYISAPFPLTAPPNGISMGSKVMGGQATLRNLRMDVADGSSEGQYVVVVDFTVVTFEPGAYLLVQPPEFSGTAGQTSPCCA